MYTIIRCIAKVTPLGFSIDVHSGTESGSSDIVKSSLLPLLPNKKFPKWWINIMLFIFSMIFFYIIFFVFPVEFYVFFKYLKFLFLLWLILLTLYNLLNALIIIISNSKQKDITIFNYYPKFVKNHLNYLMKIRKSESINIFILLYLKTALFSFLLLILFILIIYLFK